MGFFLATACEENSEMLILIQFENVKVAGAEAAAGTITNFKNINVMTNLSNLCFSSDCFFRNQMGSSK